MHILIKTLTSKILGLDVEPDHTIQSLKEQIEEKEGIPPYQQRLIFMGKPLDPIKSIVDYNIKEGSTIHLVLNIKGGGRAVFYAK
uniref:Ubiquitin-like domain-containing protein n=1 Tax=Arcella intermedia TaxID=1963864 RepID=A0A6B2LWB4_9EUKA